MRPICEFRPAAGLNGLRPHLRGQPGIGKAREPRPECNYFFYLFNKIQRTNKIFIKFSSISKAPDPAALDDASVSSVPQ